MKLHQHCFWPWCDSTQGPSRADFSSSSPSFFLTPPPPAISRARSARPSSSSSSSARAPSARGSQLNSAEMQKSITRSILVRFGRFMHQNALEFDAEFKKCIPKSLSYPESSQFSIFPFPHPPISQFPHFQHSITPHQGPNEPIGSS